MDLSPVYELQERLRATAIAGANLLQEDFRLKRAAQAIQPLATASPVFAKLCQQMELLLSPECNSPAGVLLDTIALADAVICTLATVDVKAETREFTPDTDISPEGKDTLPVTSAPYSQVKGLIDALSTTGSGNFSFVNDMLSTNPGVFKDYRVIPALIKSLGASYSELAELTKKYLMKCSPEIIPLLKKDFDPRGKKEMVHRADIIGRIAGASENDFYIKMLETATGDVRTALIDNLRYEPSNFDLLLNMAKREKGKNKQCVLNLISQKEDGKVYDLFKQLIKKSPVQVLSALTPVTTGLASKVIAETCMEQLPGIIQVIKDNDKDGIEKKLPPFYYIVETLVGKHGKEICECYKQLLSNSKTLDKNSKYRPRLNVLNYPLHSSCDPSFMYIGENDFNIFRPEYHPPKPGKKLTWEVIIGNHIAQSLAVFPDSQLMEMAEKLYENSNKNISFLAAAAFARILKDSNCTGWFDEQFTNINALTEIQRALSYIKWDSETNGYITYMEFNTLLYSDSRKSVMYKIQIPQAAEIKNWIMEQGNGAMDHILYGKDIKKQARKAYSLEYQRMDAILNKWIDTTDRAECEKYGSYFYKKALAIPDNTDYLRYMLNCRYNKCKGLGTGYARNYNKNKQIQRWQITNYLFHLPGTLEEIHKEIDAVIEIIKSGEVKVNGYNLGTEKTESWFNTLKTPSNYVALSPDGYNDSEVD